MAIPVSIEKLLSGNVVEWARIEFKKGWNPDTTLKTICAFANDIDNWGGGYIIIGAEEKNGTIVRPIRGLALNTLDTIQKYILRYCKFLVPSYIPICQPVEFEGAMLIVIWVPGGYDRPYRCPKEPSGKSKEKTYYIRKLSSTIEATDSDVKELMTLSNNIPFDDRMNMNASVKDLKHPLIRNYLAQTDSMLYNNSDTASVEKLAEDLRIVSGPPEFLRPLNVGLLFFNDDPEKYFPYARIELVNIPDPTGQGMEERIFSGPIDQQLRNALSYIKNNVIAEKVFKTSDRPEAARITNYSYVAIEEFVSNAVYHKSYQSYDPITIRIEKEQIEITSIPGPDRSISDDDIKSYNLRSRRYRNRRIGDFLKDLNLVEGRNTGFPTAISAIKNNGSPMPILLTDDDRTFFSVILPIHTAFRDVALKKEKTAIRKSRTEIKELILSELAKKPRSLNSLYLAMGYSGSPSKTYREIINELIENEQICYADTKHSSKNILLLKEKNK